MTTREKLLKYILGVCVAGSMALTGTSCGTQSGDDVRIELASEVSADAKQTMFNIYQFNVSTANEKYYVNFYGHFASDKTIKNSSPYYAGHKHYCVSYEVSKDDYIKIFNMNSKNNSRTNKCSEKEIKDLIQITQNYDPSIVEEIEIDGNYCE